MDENADIDRRTFNKLTLGSIAAASLLDLEIAKAATEKNDITHGPIVGGLTSSSVRIWGRTARAGLFRVRYGLAKDQLTSLTGPINTSLDDDNTGWTQIDGLKPRTTYYYELVSSGSPENSPSDEELSGSFRTLPRPEDYVDKKLNPKGLFNFSFEFGCCANQGVGKGCGPSLPAFTTMLNTLPGRIDFAIQYGDWIYEDRRDYSPESWYKQVGITADDAPRIVQIDPTIVGVWENYKSYLTTGKKNLAAYHRVVPNYFMYDDHEICGDVIGMGSPGLRDRRVVYRDMGVTGWYDYLAWANPEPPQRQGIQFGRAELKTGSDVLFDSDADFSKLDLEQVATLHVHWGGPNAGINDNSLNAIGGDPNAGVYEIVEILDKNHLRLHPAAKADSKPSYSIGRQTYYSLRIGNCEFFICDSRTNRQMHDIKNPTKPGVSMLGLRQKKWLKDSMAASDADFLFVISSVTLTIPHVGGGPTPDPNKDDAWTSLLHEREELIDFWDQLQRPVFVLTGDLHNSLAIKITDRVWEFGSAPHNTMNHRAGDTANRPASGLFKWGPREVDIRWSTWFSNDIPREQLQYPMYCVAKVNNVFNNPVEYGGERWVAFERPQVVFQFFDGKTGELQYAESITAIRERPDANPSKTT